MTPRFRLALLPVPALSSREEVFLEPARGRARRTGRKELRSYRIPHLPPLSPEHQALQALRREIDLSDQEAARALGLRLGDLQALERGEVRPASPEDWSRALDALRAAAEAPRAPAAERW